MTPGDGAARAILAAGGQALDDALSDLASAERAELEARRAWLAERDELGRRRNTALQLAIAAGADNREPGTRFPDVVDAHRAAPPRAATVPVVG